MYQYAGYYKRHQATYISDVRVGRCSVLGSLERVKTIITKNDKKMIFATLKDETGTISLTVFSDFYLDFKDIPLGSIIFVQGHAEYRNNEMQMVVEQYKVL